MSLLLRLDKYLADAGIGTRSEIKKYIRQGHVCVNGAAATRPDVKVHPGTDHVTYKKQTVSRNEWEYYLLNKPAGYVSATKDNLCPTVLTLIDSSRKDLFPVGRLDKDTEGLLLITNDGALAHRLLSPSRHIDKTYYAVVEGNVTERDIAIFEDGVPIGDADLQTFMPARLMITEPYNIEKNLTGVEVTIQEGKFHQIKRMFHAVGKKVQYLKRLQMGTLQLPEDLPPGQSRPLTAEELETLFNFLSYYNSEVQQ